MATRQDEMRDAVRAFHAEHPEVWGLFCRFAFDRIESGFKSYSARGIWHRIRWETAVPGEEDEGGLQLNNNHTPFYARAFMRLNPEYEGFFRLRKQRSEGRPARGRADYPEPEVDPAGELSEEDEWPLQGGGDGT